MEESCRRGEFRGIRGTRTRTFFLGIIGEYVGQVRKQKLGRTTWYGGASANRPFTEKTQIQFAYSHELAEPCHAAHQLPQSLLRLLAIVLRPEITAVTFVFPAGTWSPACSQRWHFITVCPVVDTTQLGTNCSGKLRLALNNVGSSAPSVAARERQRCCGHAHARGHREGCAAAGLVGLQT